MASGGTSTEAPSTLYVDYLDTLYSLLVKNQSYLVPSVFMKSGFVLIRCIYLSCLHYGISLSLCLSLCLAHRESCYGSGIIFHLEFEDVYFVCSYLVKIRRWEFK